jgi:hypothetical protein
MRLSIGLGSHGRPWHNAHAVARRRRDGNVIAFVALLSDVPFFAMQLHRVAGRRRLVMGAAVMHYRKNIDAVAEWFCYWGFLGSGNDDWPKT